PAGPAPIISFTDGLETIPRALADHLPAGSVELNARVTALVPPSADQPWQVQWTSADSGSPPRSQLFSAVLLALPAAALARLTIGTHDQRPLAALVDVEYPPVSSLFLGYRSDQIDHPLDGFGLLVPPIERRPLLGVLFNST